jgi:hypothetical protein
MSDTIDIADRLRISWTSMTDMGNAERLQAADEIARLREQLRLANIDNFNTTAELDQVRAERDQARAEVVDRALGLRRDVHWDKNSPERLRCMKFAQQRGWHDLFSEINAKVDAMNTAKKGEE